MTKDAALKQALEALNSGVKTKSHRIEWIEYDSLLVEQAITAIKEALAQTEQEPVAWEQFHGHLVERNFCPRCGKRTADLTTIHTCTPPQENT